MYMCLIPNCFCGTDILLYNTKIVVEKGILRTVSITDIYCSRYKVGTVYLIFENSTVNIRSLCTSCEDMACCYYYSTLCYCTVKKLYLGNRSK
jgi:hypothetical protein